MSEIRISRAAPDDTSAIVGVIRQAFGPVGVQYGDPNLPPLTETVDEFVTRFPEQTVLKAMDGDRIVGVVLGEMKDGTCEVGRLAVLPAEQGRGVGRALAKGIESCFPDAERFELFTGHASEETLGLYRSLGYREFGRKAVSEALTLVYLEKLRG